MDTYTTTLDLGTLVPCAQYAAIELFRRCGWKYSFEGTVVTLTMDPNDRYLLDFMFGEIAG